MKQRLAAVATTSAGATATPRDRLDDRRRARIKKEHRAMTPNLVDTGTHEDRSPRAVEARILCLLGDLLGVDVTDIDRDVSLVDDLAADSLDLVEIALTLEENLGIELPERVLGEVRSCGELIDAVALRIRAPGESAQSPMLVRARLQAPGWTVERVLPLTGYTAETIAEDLSHAGPEAELQLQLLPGTGTKLFHWIGKRWATFTPRRRRRAHAA